MEHKKLKDLIPQFAEKLGVEKGHLDIIMSEYYKYKKKQMIDVEDINIKLEGMGYLFFLRSKLEKTREDKEKEIAIRRGAESKERLQKQLAALDRADMLLMKEAEGRLLAKERKQIYREFKGESTEDME